QAARTARRGVAVPHRGTGRSPRPGPGGSGRGRRARCHGAGVRGRLPPRRAELAQDRRRPLGPPPAVVPMLRPAPDLQRPAAAIVGPPAPSRGRRLLTGPVAAPASGMSGCVYGRPRRGAGGRTRTL